MRRLALPLFALLAVVSLANARVAGLFKAIPVTDAVAKKAADFAVKSATATEKKTILLKKLKTAEQQVRPTDNYRLILDVTVDGVPSAAMAMVHVGEKDMELTRWKLFVEEK